LGYGIGDPSQPSRFLMSPGFTPEAREYELRPARVGDPAFHRRRAPRVQAPSVRTTLLALPGRYNAPRTLAKTAGEPTRGWPCRDRTIRALVPPACSSGVQSTNAPLGEPPIVVVVMEVVGVVVDVVAIAGTFLYLIFSGSTWRRISPAGFAGGAGGVDVDVPEPVLQILLLLLVTDDDAPLLRAADGRRPRRRAVGDVVQDGGRHAWPGHIALHGRAVEVRQDLGSGERCVADRVAQGRGVLVEGEDRDAGRGASRGRGFLRHRPGASGGPSQPAS